MERMTREELTTDEIIKALDCCRKNSKELTDEYCHFCPMMECELRETDWSCFDSLLLAAVDTLKGKEG